WAWSSITERAHPGAPNVVPGEDPAPGLRPGPPPRARRGSPADQRPGVAAIGRLQDRVQETHGRAGHEPRPRADPDLAPILPVPGAPPGDRDARERQGQDHVAGEGPEVEAPAAVLDGVDQEDRGAVPEGGGGAEAVGGRHAIALTPRLSLVRLVAARAVALEARLEVVLVQERERRQGHGRREDGDVPARLP